MNDSRTQSPPSLILTAAEAIRGSMELSTLMMSSPYLLTAPRGDGHKVIVLPGFSLGDASTLYLQAYLTWLGYRVATLGVGPNYGARTFGKEYDRFDRLISGIADGERVSLVGHSLGGVLARQFARKHSSQVRRVICLGSPIAGDEASMGRGVVWLRRSLTGEDPNHVPDRRPLPVPHTIIYSKTDGVVAPFDCREDDADNVEVIGSHIGLVVNCMAFRVIADRLAGVGASAGGIESQAA